MKLQFDMHIHSSYSNDSCLDIRKILKTAYKTGLNGIAITDHDTIAGGIEAQDLNTKTDFIVIVGTEVASDAGDIIGLFLTREINERRHMFVIDEIHEQGGLAVLPHPFRAHKLNNDLIEAVDLIEACNARTNDLLNKKASELALLYGKQVLAGSDAHFNKEIGAARTVFSSGAKKDLKEAMLYSYRELSCKTSPERYVIFSQVIKTLRTKQYSRAIKKVWAKIT